MVEVTPPKDNSQLLFENVRRRMRQVLYHPLVPPQATNRLVPLLDGTELLDDEQYLAAVKGNLMDIPDVENSGMDTRLDYSNAIFLHTTPRSKERIIVRRRYLATDSMARYFFQDLLAEELAHALAKERVLPFNRLKDNSYSLLPFKTRRDVLADIQKMKEQYWHDPTPVDPAHIRARIWGFSTRFSQGTAQGEIELPESVAQHVLEETRAAIVQTLLEAIYIGRQIDPQAAADDTFDMGLSAIYNNAQLEPAYYREAAAIGFLADYLKQGKPLKAQIIKLISDLYNLDIDAFNSSLTAQQRRRLTEAIALIFQVQGQLIQPK